MFCLYVQLIGKEAQLQRWFLKIPFQCNYCKQYFCNEHILPEMHLCPNMPSKKQWRVRKSKIDRKMGYIQRLRRRLFRSKS
ncbi:MAG: nucleotide-binding protein [Asgard group archaeon]|nr:nucleotide-binding protein [Asgard group archaeon]